MLHFANSTSGVPTSFLRRQIGLSHKAAFRMADRIRVHLAALDFGSRVGMAVELVDVRVVYLSGIHTAPFPTRGSARAVILGDANSVQATVIGRPRRHSVKAIIADKVAEGAIPVTTCRYTYRVLTEFGSRRPAVVFVPEVPGGSAGGGNPVESFLAYLRKPMHSTYRRVGYTNLWKYLKEFEFFYNRRARSHTTFWDMIGNFPQVTTQQCLKLEAWSSRIDQPVHAAG